MKKVFLSLTLISVLFFSCNEKSGNKSSESKRVKKIQQSVESMIIYSGWDLYEEREDSKMYAVLEAECGDSVKIYLNDDNSIDQKIAVRHLQSGKEESLNFVHVQYDGEDYWTRDIFLSGIDGANNKAVVIADSFLYSSPSGSSITSNQIKEGTFVALSDTNSESLFYEAVIYNGNPFGKKVYLKSDSLSTEQVMIEIVKTFSKLNDNTKPEIYEEILGKLIETTSNSSSAYSYLSSKGFLTIANISE